MDMANPQKAKGDKAERDAVVYLQGLMGDHCHPKARRKLGAGRKEDTGDLYVLLDTAIQVKAYKNVTTALWSAASGAQEQADNGDLDFHVGMVPVPRARETSVRWLFVTTVWPTILDENDLFVTGLPSKAVEYVRNDKSSTSREARIALVRRASTPDMIIAPGEAWRSAYVTHHPVPPVWSKHSF